MKRMAQFRYTKDNNIRNVREEDLLRGNIFEKYPSISKLGIQGEPGTSFVLNSSEYEIMLGETGIYEIDLEDRGFIHSINFSGYGPFTKYCPDGSSNGSVLLIDIVYEG